MRKQVVAFPGVRGSFTLQANVRCDVSVTQCLVHDACGVKQASTPQTEPYKCALCRREAKVNERSQKILKTGYVTVTDNYAVTTRQSQRMWTLDPEIRACGFTASHTIRCERCHCSQTHYTRCVLGQVNRRCIAQIFSHQMYRASSPAQSNRTASRLAVKSRLTLCKSATRDPRCIKSEPDPSQRSSFR